MSKYQKAEAIGLLASRQSPPMTPKGNGMGLPSARAGFKGNGEEALSSSLSPAKGLS